MNPIYNELAAALEKRLAIIADREWAARDAADHLEALRHVSENLDTQISRLPKVQPGELKHYLERRSFDKALAWIQAS